MATTVLVVVGAFDVTGAFAAVLAPAPVLTRVMVEAKTPPAAPKVRAVAVAIRRRRLAVVRYTVVPPSRELSPRCTHFVLAVLRKFRRGPKVPLTIGENFTFRR